MENHLLFYDDILNRMKKIENKSLLYKIPMLIRIDGLKETLKYLKKKDRKFYESLKKYLEESLDEFKVNDYLKSKSTITVMQEIRMCQSVYKMLNKMILVNEHLLVNKHSEGMKNDNNKENIDMQSQVGWRQKACEYLNEKSSQVYRMLYKEVDTIDAITAKNMVVGLGESSVKEVSMKKHHIFDVPYIPASSIKGIFRHFCEEDVKIDGSKISKWFGTEEQEGQLVFVDLYPKNPDEYIIDVDVMTPHYSSYYTDDTNKKLPVDSENPIPIKFSVLSNTSFSFCFFSKIKLQDREEQELKELFMKCIHERLFGAKTSVGYGQVTLDNSKEQKGDNVKTIEFLQENENRKNIKIKFYTQLSAYGANEDQIEFRITELKSAMRYWWRACNAFEYIKDLKGKDISVKTMKEEEGKIFGNQEQISPLLLRYARDDKNTDQGKKELMETNIILEVRKNKQGDSYVDNISQNEKIEFRNDENNACKKSDGDDIENNKKKDLDFYENILYLTSFLGGLGKESRKGKGVFAIDGKPIIEKEEELVKEIKRVLELVSNTEWKEIEESKEGKGIIYYKIINSKIQDKENSNKINEKNKEFLLNYPYIEEIYIGKQITKNEFKKRVDKTIEDRAEYKFTNGRFASPVYITCYRAEKDGFVFPIVTILHNTALKNIESSEKKNNTMKKSYKEKYRKNWNKNKGNSSKENEEVYYENYKAVCIETMFDSNDH